jgi:aspartate aminotransferase
MLIMNLSPRLNRFSEPETLKMAKLGRELRAQGIDIIDLSLGEPDFDTPQHIKDAAKKAIDDNYSHYTPVGGYLDLKEAVCHKFKTENNLDYKPENIVCSTGAKQSLANAVMATVDKGDDVIIPTPYWVTYSEIVKIAEANAVLVPTKIENNYKLTPAELEAAITPNTKLFMFSSPCNPSGAFYSKAELESLVEVFKKYPHIFIISDEIYEYINYVGQHESIAQFDAIKDRVIIVNGLSKGYAMTGWRLGYIAANVEVAKACEKLQGQFTSGPTAVTQRAAIVALTSDNSTSMEMVKAFTSRRARVLELIATWPGVQCSVPDGAFYIFPQIDCFFGKRNGEYVINDADDFCMYLLNVANVSTVTGRAFGNPKCIRISYANSMEKIEEAYKRMKAAIDLLN